MTSFKPFLLSVHLILTILAYNFHTVICYISLEITSNGTNPANDKFAYNVTSNQREPYVANTVTDGVKSEPVEISRPTGSRSGIDCDYSRLKVVSITSATAILTSTFHCEASDCLVNICPSTSWDCTVSVESVKNSSAKETIVTVTGTNLRKNSRYDCSVTTTTQLGGYYTLPFDVTTTNGRPSKPARVWIANVTSTSFMTSWNHPPNIDIDPVVSYTYTVQPIKPKYRFNPACTYPKEIQKINASRDTSYLVVSNLSPYFVYKVWVTAHNAFGSTDSDQVEVLTDESDPGSCGNVSTSVVHKGDIENNDPAYIFSWTEPCFWNGPPKDTIITIDGSRPDNPLIKFRLERSFFNTDNLFYFNASRDFKYSVTLSARVENRNKKLCAPHWTILVPPGLSSATSKWMTLKPEVLTPNDGGSPLARISLTKSLLDDTNGTIKHLALMVAETGQQGPKNRNYLPLPNWPDELNWNAAITANHVLMYQATPKYWNVSLGDNDSYIYNLGSQDCGASANHAPVISRKKRSDSNEEDLSDFWNYFVDKSTSTSTDQPIEESAENISPFHCNGPLRKNIEYAVRLRVFTAAGYSDSDEMFFRTGPIPREPVPFYKEVWFYSIFPMFLATVVLTMVWVAKKREAPIIVSSGSSPRETESDRQLEDHPCNRRKSVAPQRLPSIASTLLAKKDYLEKEFKELNKKSSDWALKVPCSVGRMKQNWTKNRYGDVVPFDYNRVKLNEACSSHTDYINASFVKGFSMDTEYIACQGPKAGTVNDFWQMVFDQNVYFIVMLTSLVENGMEKCYQYYADLCESKEWMDFTVECSSCLELSSYTVRELEVHKKMNEEKRCTEKRLVRHFHFRDWPDFGCPKSVDAMLEFCDVLRGSICLKGDTKVVVHCSAGIGRTGTLIALDILLQYVQYSRKIDIKHTVLRLREQRQWMVRTLDQYIFLYHCLKTAAERHFSCTV